MNTNGKDDFLREIWRISTTLTEEAMAAAAAKGKEMGFDPNRGMVSLPESFINLSSARAVLEDAIDKQKLIQLPITVQKELLATLETISKSLQGLTSGVDEVVNLTTAIEALNAAIWKYGLHNLSDQVLGYQKKLNQLKNQELQLANGIKRLEAAEGTAHQVEMAATEIERRKSEVASLLEQVKENTTTSSSLLQQVKENETKGGALFAAIQQHEKQSSDLSSNIRTMDSELASLDTSIRKFYGEVDDYRKKIAETTDDASRLITTSETTLKKLTEEASSKVGEEIESLRTSSDAISSELKEEVRSKLTEASEVVSKLASDTQNNLTALQTDIGVKLEGSLNKAESSMATAISSTQQKLSDMESQLEQRSTETIEENHTKTGQLVQELAQLKEQIRQQIQQATGFTLFGAFQARQNEIAKAKKFWVWAIAVLVLVSVGVTFWIAYEARYYGVRDLAFWVKLSLTVPLGFAITFCTLQYGRERRLEEEYAFKSSISVSLNPYRDLVYSILEKDGKVDHSKYTEFVIDSVTNVFTPPTDKVFDTNKKVGLTEKTFKQTAEIIGTAVKAAK